jgi:hypothetical protein
LFLPYSWLRIVNLGFGPPAVGLTLLAWSKLREQSGKKGFPLSWCFFAFYFLFAFDVIRFVFGAHWTANVVISGQTVAPLESPYP